MKLIWTVKKPIKGAKTIQWIGLIGIIWWILELMWKITDLGFPKWYIIVPSVVLYIIGMIMGAEIEKVEK